MSNRLGGKQGTSYLGTNANQPPNWIFSDRNPTQYDVQNVSLGDMWLNKDNGTIWVLVSLAGDPTSKGSLATWSQLDSNVSNDVETLTGNAGGAIGVDANNNINIIGIGDIDITGNPANNTLSVELLVDPILNITGNSGGAVGPSNPGNINIVGDGVGITIVGNPGTNTLTASLIGSGDEAVQQIDNDAGSSEPTNGIIQLLAGTATLNCGSSVVFVGSPGSGGTDITLLNVTDANNNTIIGKNSGNLTLSGSNNTIIGSSSGALMTSAGDNCIFGSLSATAITSGSDNTLIGNSCAQSLTIGSSNVIIGDNGAGSLVDGVSNVIIGNAAGSSYTSNESSNIIIGFSNTAVTGDANILRIGKATGTGGGELQQSYIAGIYGQSPIVPNPRPVVIDSDGQLGTAETAGVAFLVSVDATIDDVTGDNTTYPIVFDTEVYDQGNNFASTTFTAPITGKYNFSFGVSLKDLGVAFTNGAIFLNTSNEIYLTNQLNYGAIQAGTQVALNGNICCDMDSGDVAQIQINVSGSTKTIDVIGSALNANTYFSGTLVQ